MQKINIKKTLPRKLKWGVAGCGYFLENTFLPALQHLKKSKLISVYSSNKTRAEFIKQKFIAENSFDDYQAFLQSNIDAVYISSKNSDHYMQVIQAAKAGKHILCEKPLSVTLAEAKEMVKICNKNNVILTLNYSMRHHPVIKKTKEFIDNHYLGKIVSVTANFNIDFKPNDNFRYRLNASGGGPLRDLGTHLIDLFRYLGGDVEPICGVQDNIIYTSEVSDFFAAVFKFNSGGYGIINVSYNVSNPVNRIEILGHNGTIVIDKLIGQKTSPAKLIIDFQNEGKKAFRRRANKQLFLLRDVQKAFLKNSSPLITAEDGLANMRLMTELERGRWNKIL